MTVDGGDKHFVVLRREARFGNLDALLSVGLYPYLRQRVLVPFALVEHMDMSAIVVRINGYGHQDEHPKKC